jgi:hypothetical protein
MVFVFLISAFLLVSLTLLKLWELRRQKVFWFSKVLASQDLKVRSAISYLNVKLISLKGEADRFFYTALPILVRSNAGQLKNFTVENIFKIKDNIRGQYKEFRSSRPTSSYLREISKPNTENKKTKENLYQ